jgi:CHAT domain-containing protein/tetratricopeptide (TPR) repeat protein
VLAPKTPFGVGPPWGRVALGAARRRRSEGQRVIGQRRAQRNHQIAVDAAPAGGYKNRVDSGANPGMLADGIAELERTADADRAMALARRLLQEAEADQPAEVSVARSANRLAMFFSNRAYDDEARRAANRALQLLAAGSERDDGLLAGIHNNLGQLDERGGDLAAAESHLETAYALQRGGTGHPIEAAFTADNYGAVLTRRGKLDRAEALHREALATLDAAGPKYRADVATVLGNLGLLYRRRGDSSRARAYLLRAIDTHLRVHALEAGDARIPLVNLIDLLLDQGDERHAAELIDMLLRIGSARVGAAQHPTAIALLELGSAAFGRFQLALAERIATRALALLEASAGPAAPPTLRALQLLANVHAAKGDFESAEHALLRVLNSPGIEPNKTAELLIDFGKALRERGRVAAAGAIGMFERAIALLRAGDRPAKPLLASALGNLAQVHFDNDDTERADALYAQALALGSARDLGGEYPWLVYSRGLLDYHLARHDAARDAMTKALRLWSRQRGVKHPFVATVHANLALVHWARGDFAAAQRGFEQAARLQAGEFQRIVLVGTERQRLDAARAYQGDLFKRVSLCLHTGARGACARSAAQMLLQRKGSVLDALALTQARLRERLDAASRERFDRLAELRRRISEQALSTQLFGAASGAQHGPAGWHAEELQLQSELSHAGALGAGVLAPVTLEAVRAALPAGSVLVEYLRWSVFDPQRTGRGSPWRGQRYAALVLHARGRPRWFDLGDAATIEAACDTLRAALRDPDSDPDALRAESRALHARLIAPFERLLAGAKLLLVAPDGGLNLLPFGVLGDPMLAERCVVDHIASGRDLLRASEAPLPGALVHAIVDPDFDAAPAGAPAAAAGSLHFDTLPGTRTEADVISALFPQCCVHAGADASVAALKAIERPALLHIATHGMFSAPPAAARQPGRSDLLQVGDELLVLQRALPSADDNPMRHAALALAGANRSAPGRPVGLVSAEELAALDLRGTELVVLSACDTGLGVAAHGAEFAGLRRAFAIAGAASQVISLWEVEDDAAAELMREYYRLLVAGAGRAEALREAQAALRRRPRFVHPSAWAAFVAWGAAGPLSDHLRSRAFKPL